MLWDSEQYWRKACLYARRAFSETGTSSHRPLWSALALEFLARAALTHIHPVLNADSKDEHNLLYPFAEHLKKQPRSIPLHAVLGRLG